MKRKIGVLMQGCCLLFLTAQAFALQNETRWDGFYAGSDLGAALSALNMNTSVAPGGTYFNYTEDAPQLAAAGNDDASLQRVSGGIFGGYEHQFNHLVIGGEASLNSLYLHESHAVTDTFFTDSNVNFVVAQSLRDNWQGTLRLKVGFAQNCWLSYVTAGAAATYIKYTSSYDDNNVAPGFALPGAQGSGTVSQVKFGWVLGAGEEYALNNAWALQIKYLYSNFGTTKVNYALIPTPTLGEFSAAFNGIAKPNVQSVLMGLTYRF